MQTEFVPALGAILATRRRRSAADPLVWAAHIAVVEGETSGDVQFETDRARFLGRGQTIRTAAAIIDGWPLSNTAGTTLDTIFSLRRHVRIPRGATARIAFWTLVADSRAAVLDLVDKHRDTMAFERAKTLAWMQAQMQLRHLGIGADEAHLFQRLANPILYADRAFRPPGDAIARGIGPPSTLWAHAISGDLPIVLVVISDESGLELVRQLVRAHEYWRLKQLAVDLVILNTHAASYAQDLQAAIDGLVRTTQSAPPLPGGDSRGAIMVLRADLVAPAVQSHLAACARVVLYGNAGPLARQLDRGDDGASPPTQPARPTPQSTRPEPAPARPTMEFFNGLGGFINDGRDYHTILENNDRTPAPWLNVIANPAFGFQTSTDGSGFTWAVNSQQNQLTPWSNDPVGDPPGEAIYLRDEETGAVWTPTALPIRDTAAPYTATHGQGYSRFAHRAHGIGLDLVQFVPVDDPIKISRLTITNHTDRTRHLSVTAYVEFVLGPNRTATAPNLITTIDRNTGAIFARNPWRESLGDAVAFLDLNGAQTASTCDRSEFIGRNGAMDRPRGLAPGAVLSGRAGAGFDPCGALQASVHLAAGGTIEIVVLLGQASDTPAAQALLARYRAVDLDAAFAAVTAQWDDICATVQVKTPDRALDIMLNRWLPYQILSCRVWARSAFYQSSGAYGFRDQLQDVMALCLSRPDIARAHVLRAAARQFPEGDVQHWWLAESGRGVRTRVSDDRGWLAYVVAHYVTVTGDAAVLDTMIPFLDGPLLAPGAHDAFLLPETTERQASLFDHCALALDQSLALGRHDLPLMGTGDWNDGMDRVGAGGQGESVWLGWFLHAGLTAFAGLADRRAAASQAAIWRDRAAALRDALERNAWDGDWYRRAFFDDGSPLGSVVNNECRIDSIAQSWAVISQATAPDRGARAMAALEKYLIRRDDGLALLFTPPFDTPEHDPGYIKGYPAGIRENGGQYTHGAAWAALAFLMQGNGDKGGELLSMLNPIHHGDDAARIHRYKVEPYVVCADLYSEPPHIGRGGWTWYTGSASWMYRVTLESMVGLGVHGDQLTIDPCIPRHWPEFEIVYRYRSAFYEIRVENPDSVCRGILALMLDGVVVPPAAGVQLKDDGLTHVVHVVLGKV